MIIKLHAVNLIDPQTEAHYAFHNIAEPRFTQHHTHDFYEVFLITEGDIVHHINTVAKILGKGSLVLIRPTDAHHFEKHITETCELINLAFLVDTFHSLLDYLAVHDAFNNYLSSDIPPTLILTESSVQNLAFELQSLNRVTNNTVIRLKIRALLAHIFVNYFLVQQQTKVKNMPVWLSQVCEQMQQPRHFKEGRAALLRLSAYSPEYLARNFQKYLQQTPTQYINNLRLDYATNLLAHTDLSITEISFAAGFGNLSHFYHLFAACWDMPPGDYRKIHQRNFIP